jgi:hypothetical protein
MTAVDTDVMLRLLTGDDIKQAAAAKCSRATALPITQYF